MRDVLDELDRWHQQGEEMALATLVQVHGSAPRLAGARMLVSRSGRMAGSVSGGCVENDIVARALQVLDEGRAVLTRYGIADDSELAVGLTCAEIEVLIEPFQPTPAWATVRQAIENQAPVVLAMAIAPAKMAGRLLVLRADAAVVGEIAIELDQSIIAAAQQVLGTDATRVLELDGEGGVTRVFLQAMAPPLRLVISGGSHTAVALASMAKQIGMHVTIIDARSAYLQRERFPDADVLLHASPGKALAALDLDGAFVVILTHDLKFDVPALATALRLGAAYVGAMGSRKTHARRCAELTGLGFGAADLGRIRTPIGLDLGSRSPEEIAVSILAEILAVRSERDACPLRDRPATTSVLAPRLVGIILAAGASRRMGEPKQLLPLAGRSLLQHVVDAAAGSVLDEIVLVLGHAADEIRTAIVLPTRGRVVLNPAHARGQSTSLACGLSAVTSAAEGAVVLVGDQPGVTSALIDRVVEAFLAGNAAALRPVWRDSGGGRTPGHPVVLARRIWPEAARLEGDHGARTLFTAHPDWVHEVEIAGELPPDIDDREDYRRVLEASGTAAIR